MGTVPMVFFRQSTYAAKKDDRSDSDRPNEGMFIA